MLDLGVGRFFDAMVSRMAPSGPLKQGLDCPPAHADLAAPHKPADSAQAPAPEFRVFFRAHCAVVGRIALSVLGQPDEVDDLVQDVFIIAHKHRHRVRAPEAMRSWLATITVREARRRLRRRKLRAVLGLSRDIAEAPPTDQQASTGVGVPKEVLAAQLERELDRLPVTARIAWTLRIEGHALPEVAKMCGCSLATVKRRIDRAQRKLQEVFGDG